MVTALSPLLEPLVLGPYDERQVELMVGWLPAQTRAILAEGPTPEAHARGECCRVCMAFGPHKADAERWLNAGDGVRLSQKQRRLARVLLALAEWHQGFDLERYGVEAGTGMVCFERCAIIYRAAGWAP